jgi:hypothetical protein
MAQQSKKQRILLLSLCILLAGGIAAEGVLISRKMHIEPVSVSSAAGSDSESSAEHDPEQELLDNIRAGDYTTVNDLLRAFYEDVPVPESVTEALSKRIAQLKAAYQDGSADAESVQTELRSIAMLPLPGVSESAKAVLESVRLQAAALTIYQQAEKYAAAGDYAAAIEEFGLVPKTEKELAEKAKKRIAECQQMLRESAAETAKQAFAAGDYDTALQTLDDALRILEQDEKLTELLNEIVKEESTGLRRALLLDAGTLFGKGNYAGAFAKLRDLPDVLAADTIIQSAAASYQQKYLRELPYTVSALLDRGDFNDAEARVSEAESLFPDAETVPALRALIADYQPQKLSALETGDFADFSASETARTDILGNTYDADGNLYCSYDGDASGRQVSSGTFITGGKYTKLSLTAAPLDGFDPNRTVFLEISADGKPLETYTVTAATGVLHIRLNISGAKKISFRVLPAGTEDLRSTALLLADGIVSKS